MLKKLLIFSSLPFMLMYFESCGDTGIVPGRIPTWVRSFGDVSTIELLTSANVIPATNSIFVCGNTTALTGNNDIFVLNLDNGGNIISGRGLIPNTSNDNDLAGYVLPAAIAGNCVIVGETQSFGGTNLDIFAIYLQADGKVKWSRVYYNGIGDDYAVSVQRVNGDYILAGYTNSGPAGGIDILLIRLSEDLTPIWAKTYGGPGDDYVSAIRVNPAGGFILTGSTNSFSSTSDIFIMKLGDNGSLIWTKTYDGGDFDKANDIQFTSNGYIVAGETKSFGLSDGDALVMNLNSSGDTLPYHTSIKTFGDINTEDAALSVDGISPFYATGKMSNQIYLLKMFFYNSYLNFAWEKLYGDDKAFYLGFRLDGSVIIAGNNLANEGRILSVNNDGFVCGSSSNFSPRVLSHGLTINSVTPAEASQILQSVPVVFDTVSYFIPNNTQCSN